MSYLICKVLLSFVLFYSLQCLDIKIGALFRKRGSRTSGAENALGYAVERYNAMRDADPQPLLPRLTYDIQHFAAGNVFDASRKLCQQVSQYGTVAILGPVERLPSHFTNSLCQKLHLPHLETRMSDVRQVERRFAFALHPDTAALAGLYLEMVRRFGWQKYCVVYHSEEELLLVQNVIRHPQRQSNVEIMLRKVDDSKDGGNFRETLKEIDKKGVHRVFVCLNTDLTRKFLQAALQLGMIDPVHHYILANLDIGRINLKDFQHNYVNLTGVKMISSSDREARDLIEQMKMFAQNDNLLMMSYHTEPSVQEALIHDAVLVLGEALKADQHLTNNIMSLGNLSCDNESHWRYGNTFLRRLEMTNVHGLSGHIEFYKGRRTNYELEVVQLQTRGLRAVGKWSSATGNINFTTPFEKGSPDGLFGNKTLLVTSILEDPYVMKDETEENAGKAPRYKGFCVDLLYEISKIVKFKYRIHLVKDSKYGAPDSSGKWNGMIEELMQRKADLAVASLTISYLREQVIDFTKPFMNLGISILFKRPRSESPGLFSFLNPLAPEIWLYVVTAYLIVSLLLFVLARFSPYEWFNPHPCNPDHDQVSNMFSLNNSFWFGVGTLMQQGCDINPRAVSTRLVGGIWWFFTLIIISSYTANLAAFLTVERMVSPIESAEDLAKQTQIEYGTIAGGSTMTFFRESKLPTYRRMWAFMESRKDTAFVMKSADGIERVKKGSYAYLMESTMIDYTIQRNCDLMQVGGLLDSKGYGIGTPIGSPYRDPISMAILELQEKGTIAMLYNKWWKNTGTCNVQEHMKESKASSLGLDSVGGIFVVLMAGLAVAILVAIGEFVWNSKKHSDGQQTVWSEMVEELRFAIRCHGSSKKPALRRYCDGCRHSTCSNRKSVPSSSDISKRSPLPCRFHFGDQDNSYGQTG